MNVELDKAYAVTTEESAGEPVLVIPYARIRSHTREDSFFACRVYEARRVLWIVSAFDFKSIKSKNPKGSHSEFKQTAAKLMFQAKDIFR